MGERPQAEELLRDLLSGRCPELYEEKKERKTLFYCGNELVGSVVELEEDTLAASVYAPRMKDPLHGEFLKAVGERFGDRITESGTRLSGGIEGSFYYTYVHLREG